MAEGTGQERAVCHGGVLCTYEGVSHHSEHILHQTAGVKFQHHRFLLCALGQITLSLRASVPSVIWECNMGITIVVPGEGENKTNVCEVLTTVPGAK